MKLRLFRLSNIFAWSLAILLASILFYVSQSVQRAEDRLASLKRDVALEFEIIRVLETEWSYLNSPVRLENLAKTYLSIDPARAEEIVNEVSSIPEVELPVIPKVKPVFVSAEKERAPKKQTSVIQNSDRRDFNSLLNSLSEGSDE